MIERCFKIIKDKAFFGMIVPVSVCSGEKFEFIIKKMFSKYSWISSFSNRPGKLFDGVEQRLSIFVLKNESGTCYSSAYQHWYSEERSSLFQKLFFGFAPTVGSFPLKTGSVFATNVISKLFAAPNKIFALGGSSSSVWFHDAPTYWVRSLPFCPEENMSENSSHYHEIAVNSKENAKLVTLLLASSAFYISYKILSNCRDFGISNIQSFCFPREITNVDIFLRQYAKILTETAKDCGRQYDSGYVSYKEYYPAKCKHIIDLFDTSLARGYGYNESELDWVINYDIKYRLGED